MKDLYLSGTSKSGKTRHAAMIALSYCRRGLKVLHISEGDRPETTLSIYRSLISEDELNLLDLITLELNPELPLTVTDKADIYIVDGRVDFCNKVTLPEADNSTTIWVLTINKSTELKYSQVLRNNG